MNDATIYCKRLRLLLENMGMNQKEFAEITGITETAICRYLQGSRIPNAASLISIAHATSVSIDWLLGHGSDEQIEMLKEV
jgi:transcriptional regulator with XRE-family HTH domain